ncbi:S4 domain-containing protein YaaA [Lactobacillaceae bacterium L1_55_11]|nr:S4 domain-containing protein YaaA [Lactobacillaceae bacterium L1_55_11]
MPVSVAITSEYITLGQLLKIENLIRSGGQAKQFLATHPVTLNQESEQRRGKKLYPGDQVEVAGQLYEISAPSPAELAEQADLKAREKALQAQYQQPHPKRTPAGDGRQPRGPGSWN